MDNKMVDYRVIAEKSLAFIRETGLRIKSYISGLSLTRRQVRFLISLRNTTMVMLALICSFFFLVSGVPYIREHLVPDAPVPATDTVFIAEQVYKRTMTARERELSSSERRYNALTPGQNYLVVNTTDNRFYLYRNRTLLREGFCSSGSYINLKTHDDREWIFRTPKGQFRILGKTTYPVWKKPDWAFIEEGLPVPPPDHHSRFEYGSLGDYALSLGDGYLIHGTLYKRSLGMPVTHGCIRMNDDDLKYVFNALNMGSKVYIY
jgi:lipoprotein-anchoring transpeptidase ErfK/SrfK